MIYQIIVEGSLDPGWSDWFGEMELAQTTGRDGNPVTVLTGSLADQAALRGILTRLWDLNLTLISVVRNGRENKISGGNHGN
jgi:hypothetical protein